MYLSLHGAAITATRQTPELDFVRDVREQLSGVPIGASFDLHGNLAPELASLLDVVSVYRTHPHVDMAATAKRVLDDLDALRGGHAENASRVAQRRLAVAKLQHAHRRGPDA